MINFFRYLGWALAMLPDLVRLVKAIEQAAPVAKKGAEKMALLKGMVTDLYNESKGDDNKLSLDEFLKLAVILTNRLVAFFNTIGW